MIPPPADRPKLAATLDLLSGAVEELLLGGLTTASETTRGAIDGALREAARFRLLRLGSALRAVGEELGRFHRQDPAFSRRRLAFFLDRSWLLARGIAHALKLEDEAEYDRLTWSPAAEPLRGVEVACLGAVKKVAAGSFVAFEFRLRALADAPPVVEGQRLSWSVIFPIKPGVEVPPEGYLHLPQKQKFVPILFLEGRRIRIGDAGLARDDSGGGRVLLNEKSIVVAGAPFDGWDRFLEWSPAPAAERVARHRPDPLELDNEVQEEVVLRDYRVEPPIPGDEPGQSSFPVVAGPLRLHAHVGPDPEGTALRKKMAALSGRKRDLPPLYGLMHYERCRLVLQPLTSFAKGAPDYLTLSRDIVNKAALLKALSFT